MLLKCGDFVRVRVCSVKNIFFVRTNRKLKFAYKNRKNPDKIRVFLWLYLFYTPLVEAAGVEPASESALTGLSPGAVKI